MTPQLDPLQLEMASQTRIWRVWHAVTPLPLEAIKADDDNNIYAITSHSRTLSGNFPGGREKLVRFQLKGTSITNPRVIRDLKKHILDRHEALRGSISIFDLGRTPGFNIEGLAFDQKKKQLLIG